MLDHAFVNKFTNALLQLPSTATFNGRNRLLTGLPPLGFLSRSENEQRTDLKGIIEQLDALGPAKSTSVHPLIAVAQNALDELGVWDTNLASTLREIIEDLNHYYAEESLLATDLKASAPGEPEAQVFKGLDGSGSSEQGTSILGPSISSELLAASAKGNEKTPPSEVPSVHTSLPPSTHLVIPLGREFPTRPIPHELFLPASYLYLGPIDDAPVHHFYREQDKHLALRFPGRTGKHPPFLIDKYAITNQQFCMFLNDLLDKGLAKIEERLTGQTLTRCIDTMYKRKRLLAIDANDYWQTKHLQGQPWGIYYQDETWQPLVDSALLPATLVTWWGAYLYGLWAHRLLDSETPPSCLPPSQFWLYSAQYDLSTGKMHSYPWGNIWDRFRVNYAGFWAGKEIDTAVERQREWENNSNARRNARPQPVTPFSQGQDTSGCVQLLGNVWEWCSDSPAGLSSQQHIIIGGSCISPREQCKPTWHESAYDLNVYIGFRCFFMLP